MTPQELEALLAAVASHERDRDREAADCVRATIVYKLAPALLDLWRAAEKRRDFSLPNDEWVSAVMAEDAALARLREVRL